jgi:hypothetical protein
MCLLFSPQLHESADVCDVSQLLVFIRMLFNDGNIKGELLKTIPLDRKTRDEDTFQSFYVIYLEINVSILKHMSITADGAAAMRSENFGLIWLYKQDPLSRTF